MADLRYFDIADRILAISRQIRASGTLADTTLTGLESSVMRCIDRSPGISASAAARAVGVASSNFSRALTSLEGKGYVRREPDPRDARSIQLFPTPQAAQNLATLHERWDALIRNLLPPDQADVLADLLGELEAQLSTHQEGATRCPDTSL